METGNASCRLTKLQRLASLGITAAMRTISFQALGVLFGLPSLPVYIKKVGTSAFCEKRDVSTWRGGEGIMSTISG